MLQYSLHRSKVLKETWLNNRLVLSRYIRAPPHKVLTEGRSGCGADQLQGALPRQVHAPQEGVEGHPHTHPV